VKLVPVGPGILRLIISFGFMETPDVLEALKLASSLPELRGLDPERITYYFRRVMVVPRGNVAGMALAISVRDFQFPRLKRMPVEQNWLSVWCGAVGCPPRFLDGLKFVSRGHGLCEHDLLERIQRMLVVRRSILAATRLGCPLDRGA
jgi:hypothetical protein